MIKKLLCVWFCLFMVGAANAATVTTLDGSQNWTEYLRGAASQDITTEQPRYGNGSLMQSTSSDADKAVAYFGTGSSLGTLSEFASGTINFDFYRDGSSTVADHFAPAFELGVDSDGDGVKDVSLKWEAVYNGYGAISEDIWITTDNIADEYWWMWNGNTIADFDVTLSDWASGYTNGSSTPLSGDATILWVNISLGSGWDGLYEGFVDGVSLQIGNETYYSNFESVAVPVPGALLMAGLGVVCTAGYRRRTRPAVS